jgi:outer membrane protein
MKLAVRTTFALIALVLAVSGPLSAQRTGGVVYIDGERLRREAPGLLQARERLQQEMGRFEAQADSALAPLQQELQRLAVEFQQQQSTMAPEARRERQQTLNQKQQELQQQGARLEQQAAARQNEILGPALARINEVIQQIREERGYTFILDVAAGGVLAADPALDITGEVLSRLNAVANQDS